MIKNPPNNTFEALSNLSNKYPDKVFAIFPKNDEEVSYKELFDYSIIYSKFLIDKGIKKDSRVSILLPKSKEFLFSYMSVLNTGAILHVIDHQANIEDAARNIKKFRPNFIIFSPALENFILSLKEKLNKKKENNKSKTTLIKLADQETIIKKYEKYDFDQKKLKEISKKNPAICVFTSGTTGEPKGILSSHENIIFAGSCLQTSHNLTEKDRVLSVTPLSGTNGQIFTIWAPLITGGSVVYYQEMFTPYRALEVMSKYKVTWFNGIPTHYSLIVNFPVDKEKLDLSSLKFMRSASAPLPLSIQERFEEKYNIPIIETMGLSEMTGQVFSNSMIREMRKKGSVGKPINTELKIVNSKGKEVEIKQEGEILVKNPGLMLSYFEDKKTTKKAVKDGWLYTGDLGYKDEDGFVYIKGRKKDIIIVGGKNVSAREVEEVLYQNKKVCEALAFGVPDKLTGEKIVTFIKLNPGSSADENEIKEYCKEYLSEYKHPKIIKFCDNFPRGGQGKTLKVQVKKKFMEELRNGN